MSRSREVFSTRGLGRAVLCACLLATRGASGEASAPINTGETGTTSPFRPIRYLEDYDYLAASPRRSAWEAIKYVPLWPGAYVSFGGQHRLRYDVVRPEGLGIGPERTTSSALFVRNLLHADIHPVPHLRVFGQLGGFYALRVPSEHAGPPDVDVADVTQLFIEARASLGRAKVTSRVGRQEMSLGSTRWVGTRDGTNVRQSFDLARVTLTLDRVLAVETFLGSVPELRRGAFDDAPDGRNGFWGTYATVAILPDKLLSADGFYLGRRRRNARYGRVSGSETRHTLGLRLFGETAFGLEYIAHALGQVGAIGEANVRAWGLAMGLWQRLPGPLAPVRFGVRGDALSGDRRPDDGTVTTFHPLFPNQTFFSALPAIYPTNLYDVHPLLRIETDAVTLEGGCAFFWRQSVDDAVYAPPGSTLVPAGATRARYTGAQISVGLAYKANRHLAFNAEYVHVYAGQAITDAGGADVDFFGTWTTYTY